MMLAVAVQLENSLPRLEPRLAHCVGAPVGCPPIPPGGPCGTADTAATSAEAAMMEDFMFAVIYVGEVGMGWSVRGGMKARRC